jgi:hypothetical protein
VYVGISQEFILRIKNHYRKLLKHEHYNSELQYDFDNEDTFECYPTNKWRGFKNEQNLIHEFIGKGILLYNVAIAKVKDEVI